MERRPWHGTLSHTIATRNTSTPTHKEIKKKKKNHLWRQQNSADNTAVAKQDLKCFYLGLPYLLDKTNLKGIYSLKVVQCERHAKPLSLRSRFTLINSPTCPLSLLFGRNNQTVILIPVSIVISVNVFHQLSPCLAKGRWRCTQDKQRTWMEQTLSATTATCVQSKLVLSAIHQEFWG